MRYKELQRIPSTMSPPLLGKGSATRYNAEDGGIYSAGSASKGGRMANIIDYVRGAQHTFAEEPLNRVDSLVLSWIANMRIAEYVPQAASGEGITLAEIGYFADREKLTAPIYDPHGSEELLRACIRSTRFANVAVCLAASEWSATDEKQFSAVAFKLGDGAMYVAYRGTDNTLVGWKENFNMSFQDPVPSQIAALGYLEMVAENSGISPLFVGGHSKGGNLAVYAFMMCDEAIRGRIVKCFSHDGPGFTESILEHELWAGAYDKVERTIPEESIVGLLLEYPGPDATVVRSLKPGIMQHAPFSWMVDGSDFATVRAVSYDTYRLAKRLRAWLSTMNVADRERFVNALYAMAKTTGQDTFSGLMACLKQEDLSELTAHLDVLGSSDRAFFLEKAEDLVATIVLGPEPKIPQTREERTEATLDRLDDLHARMNDRMAKLEKLLGD